jgi:single-strand DNA-binding protein
MYNRVILVGNLTRDMEIRYTQSGSAIGKVGIATNRRYKAQSGEQKEEVMFIDLTFFGRTAEIANQYLRKGSKVLVEGRLVLEQWTAQDGTKRSRHSVTVENMQMLDSRGENGGATNYGQSGDFGHRDGGGYDNRGFAGETHRGYDNPTSHSASHAAGGIPEQEKMPEIDIDEDEIPF